jgi:hypothetical protein
MVGDRHTPTTAKPGDGRACSTPKEDPDASEPDSSCGPPPRKPARSERPGGNVETDARGKTHEGNTGVSGETAEDSGSRPSGPEPRSSLPAESSASGSTVPHGDRPDDVEPAIKAPAVKPAPLPDPQAVVHDPALSRDDKIDKLRRWSHDAREVETANDEGMRGTVTPSNLPAVQAALRQLGATESEAADHEKSAGQ